MLRATFKRIVAPAMNVRNEAMPKMAAGLDRDEQEQKVEITPEMIEAGIEVDRAYVWLDKETSESDRIKSIFVAMMEVRRACVSR